MAKFFIDMNLSIFFQPETPIFSHGGNWPPSTRRYYQIPQSGKLVIAVPVSYNYLLNFRRILCLRPGIGEFSRILFLFMGAVFILVLFYYSTLL